MAVQVHDTLRAGLPFVLRLRVEGKPAPTMPEEITAANYDYII